jgi:hypothetical protein
MKKLLYAAAVLGLLALPAQASPGLADVKVDVIEDAQAVRDVLRRLEERHGLNYVVSEEVLARAGTVTVRLRGVPLDVALESICSAAGLACELRGPVIVIIPKEPGARPALPRVDAGVIPERRNDPTSDVPPPPASSDEGMQAVGRVEEVDLEERRLQLRIDGTKLDFYLPPTGDGDPSLQAARLEGAIARLKPGARVALLYRREGGRSIMTDLIGGTTSRSRAPRAAMPREGEAQGEDQRVEQVLTPPASPSQRPAPAPAAPVVPPANEADAVELLPEGGVLTGRFVDRVDEVVRIRRADDVVVVLQLPPAEEGSDRRDRVLQAIGALKANDRIFVTYEAAGEAKVITGTITEPSR